MNKPHTNTHKTHTTTYTIFHLRSRESVTVCDTPPRSRTRGVHHLRRWRVPSVVRQPISLALSMMASPMEEGMPTEPPPPTGGHQMAGDARNAVANAVSVEEGEEEEEEDEEDEERESLENRAFVTAESPVARQ